MRLLNTLIFLSTLLLLGYSCSDDDGLDSCTDAILVKYGMVPYTGQSTIDCRDYLLLSEYQGKAYYSFGSACADYGPAFEGCDGEVICGVAGSSEQCSDFLDNSQPLGIIGIQTD